MSNDTVSVTGPIQIHSDSKERVAFELAELIAKHSGLAFEKKDEAYWLTLYDKCLRATKGRSPQSPNS
jgi:hypothetical protein